MHALCGYQVRWHSPGWILRKPNSSSFTEEHAQITHLSTIDSFEAKMKYYRTHFLSPFKIFTAFRRLHNDNYCGSWSTSPSLTVRRCCLPYGYNTHAMFVSTTSMQRALQELELYIIYGAEQQMCLCRILRINYSQQNCMTKKIYTNSA